MNKPRLLILSDIFGGINPEWVKSYTTIINSKYEIQYYNVLELGNIDTSDGGEMNIHNQFLNGGIDNAVESLLQYEKGEVTVLGFSIGGTIAWKACLKGLNCTQLFAVSSTRLRYETQAPNCIIKLYFGEKDLNMPSSKWFLDFKVVSQIFEDQEHQLYLEKKNALLICAALL